MVKIKPNTEEADTAILDHATGGPGIYKKGLYLHHLRETIARKYGFTSWDDYAAHRSRETVLWWEEFMKGEI
jgi:hypothetical protein